MKEWPLCEDCELAMMEPSVRFPRGDVLNVHRTQSILERVTGRARHNIPEAEEGDVFITATKSDCACWCHREGL